MYATCRAFLAALSHLEFSQPSCFTAERPQAQGAQRWSLGRGPRPTPASVSLAAPHTVLRSPTCGTYCPAPGGRWGLALHRLGPDSSGPRPRGDSPMSEPPPPRPPRAQQPASRTACSRRAGLRGHFQEGRRGRRGVPEPRRAGLPQLTASTAAFLRTRHGASGRSRRVPGRFTPRRPGVSLRARTALLPAAATGLGGWEGGAESSAWARRQASPPRCLLRPRGDGEARRQHAASAASRAGRRVPAPRKGRSRMVVRSRCRLLHVLGATIVSGDFISGMAVETKMMAFCPVAWSGPPAAIVWLPDGSSSAIFLTRNVVIRGQQRDLQGGFVCSKRAVAKRPLLNGRRAAFGGDRAGDRWQFFPYQLKKGKICIFLPTFSFRFEP